jgi:hypothetical protein
MPIELSKTQVALALAVAATSFFVVGEIMHQSRASTIPAATVAASGTPASAAMPTPGVDPRKRQADVRGACREDMQRLCGSAAPGQSKMNRCLSERRSEVSQACRDAMAQRQSDRDHRRHSMNDSRSHRVQLAQNVGARQALRERRTPAAGYALSKSDSRQTSQP